MKFKKNIYQIKQTGLRFGKNIIVTDNMNWSAEEIYNIYHDRHYIENQFRQSKNPYQAAIMPTYHWTDSKLRLFYFTCVVTLSYLQILENRLQAAGLSITAGKANEIMKTLHVSYVWMKREKKPIRMIDETTPEQKEILNALGFDNFDSCALQMK